MQPRHYTGKSEAEKQLSALLVRRRQMDEILKAEQNRLRTISPSLKSSVQRMIACLKEKRAALRREPRGHSAHVFAHGSSHRQVCANRGPFPQWLGARAVILDAER